MLSKNTISRSLHRLTVPQVLFPLIGVILLAGLWAAAWNVTAVRRVSAENGAIRASQELLDTYEAQVLRALREIDQTLNTVKFSHEAAGGRGSLAELKNSSLLPPDLLFVVSIADRNGLIVDSTRPLAGQSVAAEDFFLGQRDRNSFLVGHVSHGSPGGTPLRFSHRLDTADGAFDGVVIVAVDAEYFVSGYEASKLGKHGLLGLLGADGVYFVRRVGDTVSVGEVVDYAALVQAADEADRGARLETNGADRTPRWTLARELYGFPVAVVVGLSAAEQMAAAHADNITYLWRTALASAVIVLLAIVLGRLSWQLDRSRKREIETSLAYAKRIEYLAYHDGLTGLPNRSMFTKVLSQLIDDAGRDKRQLAILFLDLDRFKQINDTLGHESGDDLLKQVAVRLSSCVRDTDSVARLGGDEFVVVMPELADGSYAKAVAGRVLSAVAKPFSMRGHDFRVTASLGISRYPQDGLDEQTLTSHADIAMYHAKAHGKNNFQFYSAKLNTNPLERLALESSLRQALARNEFRLLYQAKREILSGRVTGMEALLRWQHPELGTVAPMQFIPIAEESGLMVQIGRWVLKTACLQNVAWQKMDLPPLTIAVNLTASQFLDEALLHDVTSTLTATGMDPKYLELEISEGVLIQDSGKTRVLLSALRAIGVRIGIGDFGTGYSSLATLQHFPIDTIKIDRSLIRDIGSSTDNSAVADAIIAMGRSLSLTVVAQGVETEGQAEFLRTHACDELQGFYFQRPLPAGEFTQLLQTQSHEITLVGRRAGLAPAA